MNLFQVLIYQWESERGSHFLPHRHLGRLLLPRSQLAHPSVGFKKARELTQSSFIGDASCTCTLLMCGCLLSRSLTTPQHPRSFNGSFILSKLNAADIRSTVKEAWGSHMTSLADMPNAAVSPSMSATTVLSVLFGIDRLTLEQKCRGIMESLVDQSASLDSVSVSLLIASWPMLRSLSWSEKCCVELYSTQINSNLWVPKRLPRADFTAEREKYRSCSVSLYAALLVF